MVYNEHFCMLCNMKIKKLLENICFRSSFFKNEGTLICSFYPNTS